MEFGKVTLQELESTDFTLPPDHPDTKKILKKHKKKLEVYVGCAKWGRPDWIGKIYPRGSKPGDFFKLYAQQFNSIELNSVFYQTPKPATVEEWYKNSPKGFLFVPKFPQAITHLKRMKEVKPLVDQFLLIMSGLKEKMGPVFIMPEPRMGIKQFNTIVNFIKNDVPSDIEKFLELRHDEWTEKENADKIFTVMKETGTGSIITDTAGRRDMVHMRLSTPSAFIRFVGNSLHPTDYVRIDEWVQRIKQWQEQGLKRLFFFMHQHEELYSPELIKYLIDELNKHCDMDLKAPTLLNEPSRSQLPLIASARTAKAGSSKKGTK